MEDLKAFERKTKLTAKTKHDLQWIRMELLLKLSSVTIGARRQWSNVSKILKEDYFEPRDEIKLPLFSDEIIT